ncbi:MAG: family 78 glycoside hydrolase catalytic domain [Bacteroidales bacterium]|nr:family 78 glycoside hydrolase catalytic domain [Bacteroidales bacterium]
MKFIYLLFLSLFSVFANSQSVIVTDQTTEYKTNPVGIDVLQPRMSWKISGTGYDIMQSAYSIRVATSARFSSSSIIWETGKIMSDESVFVPYEGPALKSGQRCYWQVRVWDNKGKASKWSPTAFWEMGLLSPADWKAGWIEMEEDTNRYAPAPHFRKEFSVSKPVARAVAYVTSHGFYELHLNGKKVGDQVLTPGWTSYSKRLQYQVYDVTGQIVKGDNALGAVLGDGWYRGTLGWGSNWAIYGKRLGLLLQIRLTHTDGTESLIISDDTWKCYNNGAIRMTDIYNGETYDATKKLTGWNQPGYNDSAWKKVRTGNYDKKNLIATEGASIRKIEEIKPVKVFRSPKGSLLVDMGQNMVGWVRIKVNGPKGTTVRIRHAEILDKYGEFYTANLRSAKCELNYTLAGTGDEVYEPRFTFMGFRYLEVSGFPGTLTTDHITGVVVHSDMEATGTYESSNPLLNQLQHNIRWGQKGNFVDVPTDCPQRDERLGWTGDAQAFFRTASFNYDVAPFFTKWLKDLAADQKPGGEIPDVIPDVLNRQNATTAAPSAGWGDVGVIIPWTMYTVYGDKKILGQQYTSMKKWVEYIRAKAGDSYIWKGGSKYGDWLFYHPPVNNHRAADGHTDHDFIATAYYAYSVSLLAEAAKVLGKTGDAELYSGLFNNIKKVFNHEYVTPAGRVGTNSQTSYVLALMFNLMPDDLKDEAARYLAEDIRSRGNHLSTGFLGTIYLCHVLSDNGYTDVAYDLLMQESYPSWLYPVKMGATTIWERWDGQKPDSTFQDAGMNSFNHYAYGAIGDWMYRVSAGIEARKAGYKEILIQPHITKKLDYSKASFESMYGTISSGWERKDGKIILRVSIPANTRAVIMLPVDDVSKATQNGIPVVIDKNDAITATSDDGSRKIIGFTRGSGDYIFEYSE